MSDAREEEEQGKGVKREEGGEEEGEGKGWGA
jgi:hypothetical protein